MRVATIPLESSALRAPGLDRVVAECPAPRTAPAAGDTLRALAAEDAVFADPPAVTRAGRSAAHEGRRMQLMRYAARSLEALGARSHQRDAPPGPLQV